VLLSRSQPCWCARTLRNPRPDVRRRPAAARRERHHPVAGADRVPGLQADQREGAAGVLTDGHRHRGPDGRGHRPAGRPGDHPPQPLHRGPGPPGRRGQALRGRDGRRADHHHRGRHDRRGGRDVWPLPHLRCAGRGPRHDAAGHRHQPRHAVRERPGPAGRRRDDQDAVGHRPGRHQRRGRDDPC
ncbi:MAG: Inosine-5'-monophosphate dehydrogenase / CBS domain, partial [uncultured Friedmanniella sp.]